MIKKTIDLKLRHLPNPEHYNILPPDMNYVYFDGAGEYPFEPQNMNYSPENAWHLSEASFLAYTHPGFARMALALTGYTGFRFFGGRAIECFVTWNSKSVITAFKGTTLRSTKAISEILTDLNAFPVDFPEGGRVHKGFLNALDEIWGGEDGLKSLLQNLISEKPRRPLWMTGHSLGGALASLAFARIKKAKGLYVFGSPRTGNVEFAKIFENRLVFRVENAGDPIIRVPPDSVRAKDSFRHIGTPVYISKDGEVSFDQTEKGLTYHKKTAKKTVSRHIKKTLALSWKTVKTISPKSKDNRENVSVKELSNSLLGEWSSHFSLAAEDWNDYFDSLDKITKLSFDRHAPVYYAVNLWNALQKR